MTQIERLEALLARVQGNRRQPVVEAVASASAAAVPRTESAAAVPRTESAVAVKHAAVTQPAVAAAQVPQPAQSARRLSSPAVAVRRDDTAPQPVQAAAVAQPTTAIARATTGGPALQELAFGVLLRRSLALRPKR